MKDKDTTYIKAHWSIVNYSFALHIQEDLNVENKVPDVQKINIPSFERIEHSKTKMELKLPMGRTSVYLFKKFNHAYICIFV